MMSEDMMEPKHFSGVWRWRNVGRRSLRGRADVQTDINLEEWK